MGRKLLYVDDEFLNLKLFQLTFESKFDVITAEGGINALELIAKTGDIEMIVSDMKMPEMNGLEFITKVKSQYPDISCYILTGFGLTEPIRDAMDKGLVKYCFSKPFDVAEIEAELSKK